MGGEFTITSKLNEGTTVTFTINLKTVDVPKHTAKNRLAAGLEGKQVLVVDDNMTSRFILKETLEQWKLSPLMAGSAREALDVLGHTPDVNLVITDLRMPGMDGIELARTVSQQHPEVPVVLMSKEGTEDSQLHGDLFTSVIHKPVRRDELHKHVISALRHQDDPAGQDDQPVGQKLYSTFAQQYPLRILIAEDNQVNQKLAMKILTKLGYSPQITQDGKEVLEVVSNSKYDLILMDVQMPVMDGLEATRMIRLCLETQPLIIAMTANSMQGDREECLRAGMDDYISKPIHLEELMILLEKWALVVKEKP
jgi:CheY-like chemotaxis protein